VIGIFRPSTIIWYGWCASSAMSSFPIEFPYGHPTDVPLVK
jgi:hypothetical protein